MRNLYRSLLILCVALAVPACGGGGGGGGGGAAVVTILVSSDVTGAQGNGVSDQPSISADGRYVAFRSASTNLLAVDDTLVHTDIFRKDLQTGAIIRISKTPAGAEANGPSRNPVISADGRYVAFVSTATDIVTGTFGGGRNNVFIHDVNTGVNGTTTLVSNATGAPTTEANANSDFPALTVVGGATIHVAFESLATNLIAAGPTYNGSNIFRKTLAGATALVSLSTGGVNAGDNTSSRPTISDDGNLVCFHSTATDLVGAPQVLDTNATSDVFVRNITGALTTRVSLTNADAQVTGVSTNATISGNGLHVVFKSSGSNLGDTGGLNNDIYIRTDWASGAGAATSQVSENTGSPPGSSLTGNSCDDPVLNSTGNLIVWTSDSQDLVNGDSNALRDVFRRNRTAGVLDRISLTNAGAQMSGGGAGTPTNRGVSITPDGAFVAFDAAATNLVVPNTTSRQIFRRG